VAYPQLSAEKMRRLIMTWILAENSLGRAI
jgi:hypothetical protein